MFKKAKYKLTGTYLVIIMAVTLSFSSVVYTSVVRVTTRALESQQRRLETQFREFARPFPSAQPFPRTSPETLKEIREKTLLALVGINILILLASGALSYYLAGKTLKPIEEMVNKQKRFISDAAHELKTPLTAMKTDLEVTLQDKKINISEAKKSLKSTIEEVDKLNEFTNRLLDQGRYQNGKDKDKFEEVDIKEIIEGGVKNLKSLGDSNKQAINSDLKSIKIEGDKVALKQLFTNLIENALKYGGIKKNIYIKSYESGNKCVVEIKDEGLGISEKDLPLIFEPFYRADKSRTKSSTNGYGLGLAICKEIVKYHNGTIEVSSKPNMGTVFLVKLPL